MIPKIWGFWPRETKRRNKYMKTLQPLTICKSELMAERGGACPTCPTHCRAPAGVCHASSLHAAELALSSIATPGPRHHSLLGE